MARGKGVVTLLDALQHLGEDDPGGWTAEVAGTSRFVDPSEAETVAARLREARERITLHGWVDTVTFLRDVDVLVCPSLWEESFGLTAAEAMAARVPVIVSDRGALPEVVGPDHPYIVRADDPADLARAITDVAGLSAEERDELIERQHRRWQTMWSPEAGRARLARLLQQLEDTTTQTGNTR